MEIQICAEHWRVHVSKVWTGTWKIGEYSAIMVTLVNTYSCRRLSWLGEGGLVDERHMFPSL